MKSPSHWIFPDSGRGVPYGLGSSKLTVVALAATEGRAGLPRRWYQREDRATVWLLQVSYRSPASKSDKSSLAPRSNSLGIVRHSVSKSDRLERGKDLWAQR